MANEKPPDIRDPNAFEDKDGKSCQSCGGTGKIKPQGAVREAICQKCSGKGYHR
jgi:DnaJ-class molecular chaperone